MPEEIAEFKKARGEEINLPGTPYITLDPDKALGMALFKSNMLKTPVLFHINWIGTPEQFENLQSTYQLPSDENDILLKNDLKMKVVSVKENFEHVSLYT